MNLLIFQNPYQFFQFYSTFLKISSKILKNERNVTNFEHVFVTRFHITDTNFLRDYPNSCLDFFQQLYFQKRKKKLEKFTWNL